MTMYLLSVHNDPAEDLDSIPEEELQQIYDDVEAFNDAVKQAGKWVFAGGLKPIEPARQSTAGASPP